MAVPGPSQGPWRAGLLQKTDPQVLGRHRTRRGDPRPRHRPRGPRDASPWFPLSGSKAGAWTRFRGRLSTLLSHSAHAVGASLPAPKRPPPSTVEWYWSLPGVTKRYAGSRLPEVILNEDGELILLLFRQILARIELEDVVKRLLQFPNTTLNDVFAIQLFNLRLQSVVVVRRIRYDASSRITLAPYHADNVQAYIPCLHLVALLRLNPGPSRYIEINEIRSKMSFFCCRKCLRRRSHKRDFEPFSL